MTNEYINIPFTKTQLTRIREITEDAQSIAEDHLADCSDDMTDDEIKGVEADIMVMDNILAKINRAVGHQSKVHLNHQQVSKLIEFEDLWNSEEADYVVLENLLESTAPVISDIIRQCTKGGKV